MVKVTSKRLRLIPVSERLTLLGYMCKVKGNATCERLGITTESLEATCKSRLLFLVWKRIFEWKIEFDSNIKDNS